MRLIWKTTPDLYLGNGSWAVTCKATRALRGSVPVGSRNSSKRKIPGLTSRLETVDPCTELTLVECDYSGNVM